MLLCGSVTGETIGITCTKYNYGAILFKFGDIDNSVLGCGGAGEELPSALTGTVLVGQWVVLTTGW